MMVRTQITLHAEHHARAKARAAALGVSFAEYMRRLVDQDLAGLCREAPVSIVFDLGASGRADIASDKHRMVAEATAAAMRFRPGGP